MNRCRHSIARYTPTKLWLCNESKEIAPAFILASWNILGYRICFFQIMLPFCFSSISGIWTRRQAITIKIVILYIRAKRLRLFNLLHEISYGIFFFSNSAAILYFFNIEYLKWWHVVSLKLCFCTLKRRDWSSCNTCSMK